MGEKPRKFFDVRQQGNEADIYIYGEITPYPFDDTGDVSAYSLKEAIRNLDAGIINVYINSPGGSVAEGWAIYNELKRHPAKVRTYGDGFIVSAALYPFMAGDERYAMPPCAFFFHRMSEAVLGNADDLRKAAEELETLNAIGRAAFTENTQLAAETVEEMEEAETWLSPEEALDLGIATGILSGKRDMSAAQSARAAIFQRILCPSVSAPQQTETPGGAPDENRQKEPKNMMERLKNMTGNRKEG